MRTLASMALAGALVIAAVRPAHAQCPVLPLSYGTGAVDRGRAIVNSASMVAQFYDKSDQGWLPGDSFVVGDLSIGYGVSMAIDGDRAIAGSAESTGSADLSGRAFVFDRVGDHWVSTELVSATNGESGFFGAQVAVSGNVAVVGATHDTMGYGDGLARAHVFEFDGTSWSQVAELTNYRWALDVEDDTIVLGDDRNPGGQVYVYRRIAGHWSLAQVLFLQIPPGNPNLGSSVALQGETLVVGASWPAVGPGFVEVYRGQAGSFQRVQHLVPAGSFPGDAFGSSVALSGSTLLVGAPSWGAAHSGDVHRFEFDGTSYDEVQGFDPVLPTPSLGWSVSVSREDAFLSGAFEGAFFRLGFANQSSFCPTTPNSTGSAGSLAVEGCDSLGGQRLTLVSNHLPAGVLGVGFFGASTTQVPYGDGFRCVGNPLFRLPGETSDATGHLVHEVDFSSGPASNLTSGQTWHFQTVYRDPASPGARFNLTNALSILITP